MKYACYSNAGRVKAVNEDAILLRVAACEGKQRGMLAVCDGVSSLNQSAYASRFVVRCLNDWFERWKNQRIDPYQEFMKIHQALYDQGERKGNRYGTTCSLFLFEADHYQVLHVGDSRIYLWQDKLLQLSVDQTLAQWQYDRQMISLAKYRHSPQRHVLTQCMGVTMPIEVHCLQGTWRSDDAVLLCSDGISNLLSEAVLQKQLRRFLTTSHHDSAEELAKAAMAAGERDNVSAVMFSRYGGK